MSYKVAESQEHKDLIKEYIKQGFTQHGFMKLIKEFIPAHQHKFLCRIIPDCYRFNDEVIQCIEVQHESKVNYEKLIKYGLIEELLFNCNSIRLDVIEHRIQGNSLFVHHQDYAYEQYFESSRNDLRYIDYQKSFPISRELRGDKIPQVWFR
jgi:hypothetical protein